MNQDKDYVKLLQNDEKELKAYMERSKWHVKKVQELDEENKKLKAILGHMTVHSKFILSLLENVEGLVNESPERKKDLSSGN